MKFKKYDTVTVVNKKRGTWLKVGTILYFTGEGSYTMAHVIIDSERKYTYRLNEIELTGSSYTEWLHKVYRLFLDKE